MKDGMILEKEAMKRMEEAKNDFRKMQEEIAPFVKIRDVHFGRSTAGEWCDNLEVCPKRG